MTQKQIVNLPIGPGVYTEETERGALGRWYSADKVRFRKGLAEKLGGWVRKTPDSNIPWTGTLGQNATATAFLGTCRGIIDWASLDAKLWSAIATDSKLYLWQDNTFYDITPLDSKGSLTNPFDTVNTSSTVTVNHTAHGRQVGDYVRFFGAAASGGLTVGDQYIVVTVADPDFYTITDTETATSTVNAGGGTSVTYEYDIPAGASTVVVATGFSSGPYGAEGYGNSRTGSTLRLNIRTWALDNWGEDLLACPVGGKIYWWDRSKGPTARAVALTRDAPQVNQYMIISQRDRHLIALGAYDYFNNKIDPLLIRWTSTEDLNDWVPTSTNTSGDLRLYRGSKIVTGVRSRLETIVFTDVSVHTMPFVGGFDVFGLNVVGENVSILGPNAAIAIDHRVLFMAEADFYIYDGLLKVLRCDVRNHVYENLNYDQRDKVYAGLNREFNEVWWYYPSRDPDAWVQQDFTLSLPPLYSLENSSSVTGDANWSEVQLLAKFEGADTATTYTERSDNTAVATFVANAEIDTAQFPPLTGAGSSLLLDGAGDFVTFPDISNYDLGSGNWCIECFVRFNTLPTGNERMEIFGQAGAGGDVFELSFKAVSGVIKMEVIMEGATEISTIISTSVLVNTWYHVCLTRQGNSNYCGFNGFEECINFDYWSTGQVLGTSTEVVRLGSRDGATAADMFDGHIGGFRITIGNNRYDFAGSDTYTVPTAMLESGSGAASIGYTYGFNSGGYTEVATATRQNGYDYTYFLTNDESILTPMEAEYAVEFDWNPSRATATNTVGLTFLHQDITGTGSTVADSFKGFVFFMDFDADTASVRLRSTAGVLEVPDNAPTGGDVTFSTATGTAPVVGTKYIFTAKVDTPNVTLYIDGTQIMTFAMSAAELIAHTGGSSGHYVGESSTAVNQARFYNFSTGPVGVLTASDFDISPIEVDRYTAFNYEEGSWTTGKLARTAWQDRSPVLDKPYATGTDGYIYQHETGVDDNGSAMVCSIESYDMEIGAGEELMHVDQLIPDFLTLEGSVDVNLTGKRYPGDTTRLTKGPYTVSPGTRKLSTRIRARQVAFKVSSSSIGDKWRMSHWRGRAGAHGKRG